MDPDLWRRIEELYNAALGLEGGNRAEFLERACPDTSIREEVLSLLEAASGGDTILGQVAADLLPSETPDLTGQPFGEYELVAFVGRGGMGDVYRARDAARSQEVAVKILSDRRSWNADAVARFEREARLLAALDHPNIAKLHGMVVADGRHGLILEFIDGQRLDEVVGGKPLHCEEALAIAEQIALALECAHAKRIIHRDLKPANVKVTPAGVVKVLDFGLAKAWRSPAGGPDLSRLSTLSSFATRDGVILGTPAYMSPEQARGKAVDKRTDLWAFGCVLFEMLAGRRPFAGRDMVETVQWIFEREPEWSALPSETPPRVLRLLSRCLRKDMATRVSDITTVRKELLEPLPGPSEQPGLLTRLSEAAARWTRRDDEP
jgi:serine/threonine protein kinase